MHAIWQDKCLFNSWLYERCMLTQIFATQRPRTYSSSIIRSFDDGSKVSLLQHSHTVSCATIHCVMLFVSVLQIRYAYHLQYRSITSAPCWRFCRVATLTATAPIICVARPTAQAIAPSIGQNESTLWDVQWIIDVITSCYIVCTIRIGSLC